MMSMVCAAGLSQSANIHYISIPSSARGTPGERSPENRGNGYINIRLSALFETIYSLDFRKNIFSFGPRDSRG